MLGWEVGCLCVHTLVTSPRHGVWGGYTLRHGCSALACLIWCLSSQLCLGLPSLPRLRASRVHEETKASLRPSYFQSEVKKLKWVSWVLSHPFLCEGAADGVRESSTMPATPRSRSPNWLSPSSSKYFRGRPGTPISAAPLGQRGGRYTSTLGSESWISLHLQFLPPKAHTAQILPPSGLYPHSDSPGYPGLCPAGF